jgi:hypothetical protein
MTVETTEHLDRAGTNDAPAPEKLPPLSPRRPNVQPGLLAADVIEEIARRCGRGFTYADKPSVAMTYDQQFCRIENFVRVMRLASRHTDRDGITDRVRAAIWAHVCLETDLKWTSWEAAYGRRMDRD